VQCAKRAKDKLHLLDEIDKHPLDLMPPLPLPSAGADDGDDQDDNAFDPFDFDQDDDGEMPSPTDPPGKLFKMFVRACRSAGLDPNDVLDKAAGGMPFQFRKKGRPKRKDRE
jgi:hypothetical protein